MKNDKIALLRGINVGGKKPIKMAALRTLLEQAGFENVRTYIQSGNIGFKAPGARVSIEKKIRRLIREQFGWDVPVVVRSQQYFRMLLEENPFADLDPTMLHVTLLNRKPAVAKIAAIKEIDFQEDRFETIQDAVFVHCPSGYQKTKLTNGFFEKKLSVPATTRNWKTINKLVDL
jgi:uncharacterized protein (DUF1697 family)